MAERMHVFRMTDFPICPLLSCDSLPHSIIVEKRRIWKSVLRNEDARRRLRVSVPPW